MDLSFRKERADWVKVLDRLYKKQQTLDKDTAYLMPNQIELEYINFYHEISFDNEQKENAIEYLKQMDYIETGDMGDTETYKLTNQGLELAHQIKTERQRRKTNRRLLYLTAILAILTIGLLYLEAVALNLI